MESVYGNLREADLQLAYLAGLVGGATANEGHVGYGVMGRTEGAAGYE